MAMAFRLAEMFYPLCGLNLQPPFSATIEPITEKVQKQFNAYTTLQVSKQRSTKKLTCHY